MNNKLQKRDLVQVKWNSRYSEPKDVISIDQSENFWGIEQETNTIGHVIYEDDLVIVLASSTLGEHLAKNFTVIPKLCIKDIMKLS